MYKKCHNNQQIMIKSTIANLRIGMFRGKKDEDGKMKFIFAFSI